MVTETQSRACIHQWWGLSAHWSNIYVKWRGLNCPLLQLWRCGYPLSRHIQETGANLNCVFVEGVVVVGFFLGTPALSTLPSFWLPFHLALARANGTKRHLCKCSGGVGGAGKHNSQRGDCDVARDRTHCLSLATSRRFYCPEAKSCLLKLERVCLLWHEWFALWQPGPCVEAWLCFAVTREQKVRMWKPLVCINDEFQAECPESDDLKGLSDSKQGTLSKNEKVMICDHTHVQICFGFKVKCSETLGEKTTASVVIRTWKLHICVNYQFTIHRSVIFILSEGHSTQST